MEILNEKHFSINALKKNANHHTHLTIWNLNKYKSGKLMITLYFCKLMVCVGVRGNKTINSQIMRLTQFIIIQRQTLTA